MAQRGRARLLRRQRHGQRPPRKQDAEAFSNYLVGPDYGLRFAEKYGYATTSKLAIARMSPELQAKAGIDPARLKLLKFKDLIPNRAAWQRVWDEVKPSWNPVDTGHIVLSWYVHKSFGSSHAVRGVSLVVRKNEFVTLLGPSGCGKTTLLRMIGGFEPTDSGTIEVAGRDVARTPARERQTRMVFQQYALFPHMTVGQNVEFGLRMRGMPRARSEPAASAPRWRW